jgi:hypothetical protein
MYFLLLVPWYGFSAYILYTSVSHDVYFGTKLKKTKLRGLSTQANYTDRATAACRRSYCKLLRIESVAWSAQRVPKAVNLGFLDRSRNFSVQTVPQLSSRGWVHPIPDTLFLRKAGSAGNRTRDLWFCSQELMVNLFVRILFLGTVQEALLMQLQVQSKNVER